MRWIKNLSAGLAVALAVTACSDSSSRKYFESKGLRSPASACTVDPRSLGQAQALPDIDEGNGCEVRDRYSVSSLAGVRFSQLATMNCGLAAPLDTWLEGTVQRSAVDVFGERVVGIDVAASYVCRGRNNARGAKMSEHGFGNAIDISAFTLESGRKVSVLADWNGDRNAKKFLRQVRGEACGAFATVLGPGSDAHHRDHIHLDLQNRRSGNAYCH
ncbi:MAG TPA: extensin family protein [Aestuariivirga sp.]|nr:extensin family protein [Aestuariivirga sp.]